MMRIANVLYQILWCDNLPSSWWCRPSNSPSAFRSHAFTRSTRVKIVKKGKNEHGAVQHATQKRGRLFIRQITCPKCTTTT